MPHTPSNKELVLAAAVSSLFTLFAVKAYNWSSKNKAAAGERRQKYRRLSKGGIAIATQESAVDGTNAVSTSEEGGEGGEL